MVETVSVTNVNIAKSQYAFSCGKEASENNPAGNILLLCSKCDSFVQVKCIKYMVKRSIALRR